MEIGEKLIGRSVKVTGSVKRNGEIGEIVTVDPGDWFNVQVDFGNSQVWYNFQNELEPV